MTRKILKATKTALILLVLWAALTVLCWALVGVPIPPPELW